MTVSAPEFIHETVLLKETVASVLNVTVAELETGTIKKTGTFVDATFGRGGHSRLLLTYLDNDSRLLVFDKDPQAIQTAQALAASDARVIVIHDSFAKLQENLQRLGIEQVDGIMADLGVSSPQLDDGSRGFSFMRDGAVDMRMDTTRGESVAQWLKRVDETVLADVLYNYGEERHSRRIARAIKQMEHYDSTLALAETIKQAHPNWQKGKHPATQSFQAMRIFINNELGDIDSFLDQSLMALNVGGRLAVISFHSLEDRIVKQFLQANAKVEIPRGLPVREKDLPKSALEIISRVKPSAAEILENPRARSAIMRVAEKRLEALV
jgi:16S rRNA (cytosine1402-N4)-methyltransferase